MTVVFNVSMAIDMIRQTDSSTLKIQRMKELFKVLSDENRLLIISCLASGEKCVCQLTEAINIPQNLISHHLQVLKKIGLVESFNSGRWRYYSLNSNDLQWLKDAVKSLCECLENECL